MSSNKIDLFMWGYQQHFRISVQTGAENLFSKIDRRLLPNVFFVGVLVEDRKDRYPICLEPDDCGYGVENFNGLDELAKQLERVDEESSLIHSHPVAQESHNKRITNKAYIEAISKILKKEDLFGDVERFISNPTYVEGYLIFVVLELRSKILDQYYSLTKNTFNYRHTIRRSFIDSLIFAFLQNASQELNNPMRWLEIIKKPDELMRIAGRELMYTASQAGNNIHGLHGLYDACNEIASMKYEGGVGIGKMIISPKDHPNVKLNLQLKHPIKVSDYRKVRKFLELSDSKSSIVTDSAFIYGLGELRGNYNPKEESIFEVNFISHFKWELSHDSNSLMVVEYKQPFLPKEKIDSEKFRSILKRVFSSISKEQVEDLWDITMEATNQKHGTMLVISGDALGESERLGNQSFGVKKLKLTPKIMQRITSIDGAVLLDTNSECSAIGVILDGMATEKGDASRGARYNSAIRYHEQFSKSIPTVIVIISEDGMINLIPDLRPQISHSKIISTISELEKLNTQSKPDRKEFYKLIELFEDFEFYLQENECKKINKLRKEIEDKVIGKDEIKFTIREFKPNDEMNDSYYK